MDKTLKTWWKESVIYQIYPRSFMDSDGDGIGDIQGIISKLDYLKKLGIDIIWISPIFDSPNDDNGYDVRDYCAIMEEFGTMSDFDEMLKQAHKKGLKIILDLVPNHSSDEHRWFQESKKSKDNPYRDYYIWKPPVNGGPPNDWISFFEGSAWTLDESTQEYYLHLFTKKQPDLNWENPSLRQEMYEVIRFWLDKGVDGFRMDVITLISKDLSFPNFPKNFNGNHHIEYANGPKIHDFLREMHDEVLKEYDVLTVGEALGISPADGPLYSGHDRKELSSVYHFDILQIDRSSKGFYHKKGWGLPELKMIFRRWDKAMGERGWNSVMLGNHDFPRMVSRFGNDKTHRLESSKMLHTLLATQRGTPYIYQGDEIGMTNVAFESIHDYDDVWIKNTHAKIVEEGGNEMEFLRLVHELGRDNARTPMQWDDSFYGGFTKGIPWIKSNPNHTEINVKAALNDGNSIIHFLIQMLKIRKENQALIYGSYQDIDPENEMVFSYVRTLEEQKVLVVLNFTAKKIEYKIPKPFGSLDKKLLIGNYFDLEKEVNTLQLRAYESRVYYLMNKVIS